MAKNNFNNSNSFFNPYRFVSPDSNWLPSSTDSNPLNYNPPVFFTPSPSSSNETVPPPTTTPTTATTQNQNNTQPKIKSLADLSEEEIKRLNRDSSYFNEKFIGAANSNYWRQRARDDGGLPKTRPIIQYAGIAPNNQDILNQYNAWLKAGNPGNTFEWRLADGTTITEQNVNNILNPYGLGKP